jgi:hypothetical protein
MRLLFAFVLSFSRHIHFLSKGGEFWRVFIFKYTILYDAVIFDILCIHLTDLIKPHMLTEMWINLSSTFSSVFCFWITFEIMEHTFLACLQWRFACLKETMLPGKGTFLKWCRNGHELLLLRSSTVSTVLAVWFGTLLSDAESDVLKGGLCRVAQPPKWLLSAVCKDYFVMF